MHRSGAVTLPLPFTVRPLSFFETMRPICQALKMLGGTLLIAARVAQCIHVHQTQKPAVSGLTPHRHTGLASYIVSATTGSHLVFPELGWFDVVEHPAAAGFDSAIRPQPEAYPNVLRDSRGLRPLYSVAIRLEKSGQQHLRFAQIRLAGGVGFIIQNLVE